VDGDEVRIAVYDQYWSTLGGGEQFAGGIAVALADHHDVTLVGPDPIDPSRFADRLGIDLSDLPLRRIDQESDVSVLSSDFDVLVNCTYQSTAVNRARHGIYVVHFPGEVAGERQRRKDDVRRRLGRRFPATAVLRSGFYQPEHRGGGRRTDGAGVVDVYADAGTPVVPRCGPSTPRSSSCGTGGAAWAPPTSTPERPATSRSSPAARGPSRWSSRATPTATRPDPV
jgi:hypothetical protein